MPKQISLERKVLLYWKAIGLIRKKVLIVFVAINLLAKSKMPVNSARLCTKTAQQIGGNLLACE